MTSSPGDPVDIRSLIRPFGSLIAWIGASAGALSAVLAALGYLVESAYLTSLGLRRGMLDLASTEYLFSGGQFLLGVLPLASVGALSFALDYWWIALLTAAGLALGTRRRFGATFRWIVSASAVAVWIALIIPRFDAAVPGSEANRLIAMMTFVVTLGVLYALLEHAIAPRSSSRGKLLAQIVFYAVLSVALLTLPYARGSKGLSRHLPHVQLPAKEAATLCELGVVPTVNDATPCAARAWKLVQLGKDRSVLLSPLDGSLYVVPASATATIRILPDKP